MCFVNLIGCLLTHAQNNKADLDKIVLPSPNVSSIQRYGNWPLGNFTGTPNISIPLFEVTSGKLKFPISLSYNSGGIRINDVGSNVGIGWVLNASGVINRTMQGGQVDEYSLAGYWEKYPVDVLRSDPYYEYDLINVYNKGTFDAQPDLFSYNAGPLNGKFVFDTLKNVHLIPYTNVKIERRMTASFSNPLTGISVGSPIIGFDITDENGTIYQFLDPEVSDTWTDTYKDDNVFPESPDPTLYTSRNYIFTWYLSNIISVDKKDTISFSYEDADIKYKSPGNSEIHAAKQLEGNIPMKLTPYYRTRTILTNTTRSKRLKTIKFNGGLLQFYENTDRKDLQGAKRLDSIVLYKDQNKKIKSYHFDYWYLMGTGLVTESEVPAGTAREDLRLFLRSVKEGGINGIMLSPYSFSYEHSLPLPSKLMAGGDTWGFANGKVWKGIGDSLTGKGYQNFDAYPGMLTRLKRPNFDYAKQGILARIQYPTGGSTSFEYEPHYREPQTISSTINVCDGNLDIVYNGVQFNPGPFPDPDLIESRKFRVTANNSPFDVTVRLDSKYNNFPTYYYIEIRDSATNNLVYTYRKSSVYCDTYTSNPYPICTKHLQLNIGTYYILPKNDGQIYPGGADEIYCRVIIPPFNCRDEVIRVVDSISVGGIRLKRTVDIDSVSGHQFARTYEYNFGVRPGTLGEYFYEKDYLYEVNFGNGVGGGEYTNEHEKIISSSGLYGIIDVMGAYIAYGDVKENVVDLTTGEMNGFTRYYYNNDIDDGLGEQDYRIIPYPPYVGQSWKRGQLLRKSYYKTDGQTASLLRDEVNYYSILKRNKKVFGEAFFAKKEFFDGSSFPLWPTGYHEYILQQYFSHRTFHYTSAYNTLDSTVVKEYDGNGNMIVNKTVYDYDTTTLLIKGTEVYNSRGEKITTSIKRPYDYSGLTSTDQITAGVRLLQQNYILSPEVEKSIFRSNSDGTNKRLLSSVLTTFKANSPLKDKIYAIENNYPLTDFIYSSVSNGAITKDSRYISRVYFNQYDSKNNLTEQQKSNDVKESYLWGYKGMYPVARIIGANYDTARQYVNPDILNAPASDQQLRNELNKLRSNLPGAIITTYTFDPLVGMTSETDPSGKVIYYEYDGLGRLKLVKDQDGKILKQYDYQYQKPVTQ